MNTKIAPDQAFLRQSSTMNSEIIDDSDPVPIYGELETTIQTHSPEGTRIEEGFEGTNVDLKKSPYVVKNDLFDGLLHVMIRDLPGNTYDFDGDKDVLWEVQMQVSRIQYSSIVHHIFLVVGRRSLILLMFSFYNIEG